MSEQDTALRADRLTAEELLHTIQWSAIHIMTQTGNMHMDRVVIGDHVEAILAAVKDLQAEGRTPAEGS